jgi:hypothetical protein
VSHEQTDERPDGRPDEGAGGLNRWAALRAGAGAGLALALGAGGAGAGHAQAPAAATIRWDIQRPAVREGDVITIAGGGEARARSRQDQTLTVTGTGTFVPGSPRRVTGGGDFRIQDAQEAVVAGGTYRVTELLAWESAPGGPQPPPPLQVIDTIGNLEDQRPGLVTLRVAYSDGREGVLTVSCRLVGTPPTVLEGVVASYGFLLFWNAEERDTLFHVVPTAAAPAGLPRTGGPGAAGGG